MNKRNNKNIDKTSIVMTALFFAIIVVGLVAIIVVAANTFDKNENTNTNDESDFNNEENIEMPDEGDSEEQKEVKYESIEALSDSFMEICKNGDVEGMYALYYDDMLKKISSETYTGENAEKMLQASLVSEMATIVDFDEYEYGSTDLPPTMTAYQYVATFYSGATNGGELDIDADRIDNCADLRVYRNDGTYRDHMMARIDGYWYLIV